MTKQKNKTNDEKKKLELNINGKKYLLVSFKDSSFYYTNPLNIILQEGFKSTNLSEYILKDEKGDLFKLEDPSNKDKNLLKFSKIDPMGKEIEKIILKKPVSSEKLREKLYQDCCSKWETKEEKSRLKNKEKK